MSTVLSIAFTGLCALIGDGDGKAGQILLLDATGVGEVGGVRLPAHAPSLVVSLNDLANPDSSRPTRVIAGTPGPSARVEQLGVWDLAASEVRIRAQGAAGDGLRFFRPSGAETTWPDAPRDTRNPASWRDLRFVPSMRSLVGDGRIDPSLIATGEGSAHRLPRAVAARVHLDAGLLQAAIPSQETYRDDMFEFKAVGSAPVVRQALTDTVEWTLRSDAAAIVIDITPVDGAPAKRLLLAPRATPHRVFISNLPSENESHADAHSTMDDEQMAALHFGAYYELLLNEPAARPLPEVSRPVPGLKGAGLMRPAFCPAAMFTAR